MDENSSAAMLATNRSAGVAPEVNLRECTSHTPLPSTNKSAQSGFETQKSKQGYQWPHKRTYVLQTFSEKKMEVKGKIYQIVVS